MTNKDIPLFIMKIKVHKWMIDRVEEAHYDRADDLIEYGEVNSTLLAEECAHDMDFDVDLDDETHWIWDLAVDVAEMYEQQKFTFQ